MSDASPAPRPCGSCPYRRDVPSGVWDASEYEKLPAYDGPTFAQPIAIFKCHQQDGRVCAGWAGCHDMDASLALRIGAIDGSLSEEEVEAVRAYASPVSLFDTGRAAADHGMTEIATPGPRARRAVERLERKLARRIPAG